MNLLNLKIAYRNAQKHKVVSIAKILGLSISFAVVFFATGYVLYETSFDKHIVDKEKIYRCYMYGQLNLEEVNYAVTAPAMARAMVEDIPEIVEAVRFKPRGNFSFNYQDKDYEAGILYHADTNFFSFFSIPQVSTKETPLSAIEDLAIAKSLAVKYFGTAEEALGKAVVLRGDKCIITTVFDDLPKTSTLDVQLIQCIQKSNPDQIGWQGQSFYTYFKTSNELGSVEDLNFKLTKLVYTLIDEEIVASKAKSLEDMKWAPAYYIHYIAEPLLDIHFSKHKFEPCKTASKTYVYGAVIIALLILLISTINFLNLNLASISMRLKEVGIRKTVGAGKRHVFIQFVQEANLFWLISFVLAALIYMYGAPLLSKYIGLEIILSQGQIIYLFGGLLLVSVIFNLLVNVVPIILVSGKKTVKLLKDKVSAHRGFNGNNGFVFIQFLLTLIIVIGGLFVQKQINYMVAKDRGYDTENVLMFSIYELSVDQRESFVAELKKHPEAKSVGTSGDFFGIDPGMTSAHFNRQEKQNYFHTSQIYVDPEFGETYNFQMADGRFFEENRQGDQGAIVINEAAAREYLGSESLVGQYVLLGGKKFEIIGIVNDFNYRSLHHKIEPLLMVSSSGTGIVNVKFEQDQAESIIAIVQDLWHEYNIDTPFHYQFHDAELAGLYQSDMQAKKLLLVLSVISIIIASMGLFAVSVFTVTRKTKEIGIHKVNGAKIIELMLVLNKKFMYWILTALIVAIPLSYCLINVWLDNFAYKTPISWWIFVLSGIVAFGIAVLTVVFHSLRAASRNPVEALRYE